MLNYVDVVQHVLYMVLRSNFIYRFLETNYANTDM